ncbi:MAG: hemerythrin family protein [Leptospiraceae bacterium]|nr:hemerythrin family protein [Leptospiraceae bacterium]MCP5503287.1 hemerythrin family protein [Leptospiraceae bacterium]
MPFILWTKENEIGIEIIDNQHKHLFDLLNTLHATFSLGEEKNVLLKALDALIEYTIFHFDTEERLFEKYSFPQKIQHQKEHNKLAEEIIGLRMKLEAGSAILTIKVLEFIHSWLEQHTMNSDRKFGEYIKNYTL